MATRLTKPDIAYQQSYNAYIKALGDEERYPFPMDFDHRDFMALLEKLEDYAQGRGLPEGFVPATTVPAPGRDELVQRFVIAQA